MSESKKQYTLNFVWLNGCGGCVTFKKNHQSTLENLLRGHSTIAYANLEYKREGENHHLNHIMPYVGWFPTFILTKNDRVVDVFNGVIENKNGKINCEHAQKMELTAENVMRWAESNINKPIYIQDNAQSIGSQRFVSKSCRSTTNYRPSI